MRFDWSGIEKAPVAAARNEPGDGRSSIYAGQPTPNRATASPVGSNASLPATKDSMKALMARRKSPQYDTFLSAERIGDQLG